mgnify:CR=1 FL=1
MSEQWIVVVRLAGRVIAIAEDDGSAMTFRSLDEAIDLMEDHPLHNQDWEAIQLTI